MALLGRTRTCRHTPADDGSRCGTIADVSKGRSVAVATCRAVPDLDVDGPALLTALAAAGLEPEVRVWDDPAVDWPSYDLVLLRSTWDYTHRRSEFLEWTQRCRRTANPAAVVSWNTDKRYLTDLVSAGVAVVPTLFRHPGELVDLPASWATGDVVVKPVVSASAADTGRFAATSDQVQELVDRLYGQNRAAMIQPYQSRIESEGETSLVHLGGRFSHAVRKQALLTEHGERAPVVGDEGRSFISPTSATSEQHAVASAALSDVPGGAQNLSYARIDLVPDDQGRPMLLELELTEPALSLEHAPTAAMRQLARHVSQAAAT